MCVFYFLISPSSFLSGLPCGSAGKESACNTGDLGLIPGLGRFPREEKGYPLQCSGLENSMDHIVHWGSQKVGHDWENFILHSSHIHVNRHFILYSLVIIWKTCTGKSIPSLLFPCNIWKIKIVFQPNIGAIHVYKYIVMKICIF